MRRWKLTNKPARPVEIGDTFMVNAPRINARTYIGKITSWVNDCVWKGTDGVNRRWAWVNTQTGTVGVIVPVA